jgi:hypothetical protein
MQKFLIGFVIGMLLASFLFMALAPIEKVAATQNQPQIDRSQLPPTVIPAMVMQDANNVFHWACPGNTVAVQPWDSRGWNPGDEKVLRPAPQPICIYHFQPSVFFSSNDHSDFHGR